MFTSSGQAIQLGRQIGAGGAGAVYEISSQPELVAKRFHSALSADHVAKLRALVALNDERLNQLTAWPIALLYDKPDGAVVGFLMNRVAQASELHSLHSPKSRLQKFPEATWEFLLYVAANVARAVATVHAHGFIIGDINPKNILVTRQATVHLLDCDSFQVRTADGQTLRCEQGFPEYTPPELQGVTFRDIDRTTEHDAFGLAVVIFQLLFLGRHPFSGRYLGEGEMPIERAIREQRFAYGDTANSREMQPPPGVLPWAVLPAYLAQLFERTFLTNERATPQEWLVALEKLAQSLKTCQTESLHLYSDHLAQCPWCELEARAGLKLFGGVNTALSNQTFVLDDIWREIDQIEAPWLSVLPRSHESEITASQEALMIAEQNAWNAPLSLFSLLAICFLISAFGNFYFLAYSIWLIPGLFRSLVGYERRLQQTEIWQRLFPSPPDKNFLSLETEFNAAQAALKELDNRLKAEASRELFFAKKDELKAFRDEYQNLNQVRLERLRELEKDQFQLQPATVAGAAPRLLPRSRWQVEQEIKERRHQLEEILEQGASTMQQVKQDIETKRQEMQSALFIANARFKQAEINYETVTTSMPTPAMIGLFLFILVLGVSLNLNSSSAEKAQNSPASVAVERQPPAETATKALDLFSEGKQLVRNKEYEKAVPALQQAIQFDPSLGAAYDTLGFAYYKLKQFKEALDVLNRSASFSDTFDRNRTLGLVFAAQQDWTASSEHFIKALRIKEKDGHSWSYEQAEFFYEVGKTLRQTGFLQYDINVLEADLERSTQTAMTYFQLGCYYLWAGDNAGFARIEKLLKQSDAELLRVLRKLEAEHNPTVPKRSSNVKIADN